VLNLVNSDSLSVPRVLYSLAREGWVPKALANVSKSGTPLGALLVTEAGAAAMVLTGSFNQLLAVFTTLILLYYIIAFLAVFVQRYRAPHASRPFRVIGYPVSTALVLAGTLALLVASAIEDPPSTLRAAVFLVLCVPAYLMTRRIRGVATT
jgi:APA family basic amino acid/polyamine antiporter